jgi:hypothetical protein
MFSGTTIIQEEAVIGEAEQYWSTTRGVSNQLNLTFAPSAKFVRHYGDAAALMTAAVQAFRADVKSHQYPSDEESYHLPKETKANLDSLPRILRRVTLLGKSCLLAE